MKSRNRIIPEFRHAVKAGHDEGRSGFPDTLIDYLSGAAIPFSNRDSIRQKLVKTLVEEKGYTGEDLFLEREIRFVMEDRQVCSPVDIAISIGDKTLLVCKCASGSVVSRERQIIATARLLEDYVVPFAVVTNGVDLELIDSISEKVVGSGMASLFSRQELSETLQTIALRPANRKKRVYEERVLYTYDSICCSIPSGSNPARS